MPHCPKSQRTRGRRVDCEEITGGVQDLASSITASPGSAQSRDHVRHHVDQTSFITAPDSPSATGRLATTAPPISDQASISTYSHAPTSGPANQYDDQDLVMGNIVECGYDFDLNHSEDGRAWRCKGAVGGSEQGASMRQGRESRSPRNRPPQQKCPQPHKGRPAQTKKGQQGKLQTCDPGLFHLDGNCPGVSGTQSESAISGQEITCHQKLFYGAHIGNETRNLEFKRGGGEYLRLSFRGHLRRYASAFLNSGGGTLLVGVDDDGVVRGLSCDHRQEDQARLLVDSILKGFHPTLLPHSYSLLFLPVVRPGPEGRNLKVLCLTLRPPPPAVTQSGLYQTDLGEVFLRRDGSVDGPLPAGTILEWARQRWSGEVSRLQHLVEDLRSERRLLLQETAALQTTIDTLNDMLKQRRTGQSSPSSQNLLSPAPTTSPAPATSPTPTTSPFLAVVALGVTVDDFQLHDTGSPDLALGSSHNQGPGPHPQNQQAGQNQAEAPDCITCRLI